MIVPEYWAQARIQRRVQERQVTVRRFGWSDVSEADAQRHADERAGEAMARIESGEKVKRRESKVPYNGADGLPIREEIVARHNEVIITRNSYGALCLNTPDVLFADVDFVREPGARIYLVSFALVLLAALATGLYIQSWRIFFPVAIGACILAPLLAAAIHKLIEKVTGGPESRAKKRIARFSDQNPDWRLRVYRTPAGYRVLAMHRLFDPNGEDTLEFLHALHSDPIYIRMCRNQRCFRARLSPKPWRIGIESHMKPRPGVWPIKPERIPERREWIAHYEEAARGYAACRFEKSVGNGTTDSRVEYVQSLHDEYCGASSDLPIA